jgi:hypothetical protein
MIQTNLVLVIGLLSIILGTVANYIRYGMLMTFAFILIVSTALYIIVDEIRCVIHGKCYLTSWINSFIGLFAFGSVAIYYIIALIHGDNIPVIEDQPIIYLNKNVTSILATLRDELGINV